jgi:hypothetical protein
LSASLKCNQRFIKREKKNKRKAGRQQPLLPGFALAFLNNSENSADYRFLWRSALK